MRKERKKKPRRCPHKLRRPVLQYIRQLEFSVINPTGTLSRLFILTQSYSPFQTALSHTEAQEELKVSR